QAPTPHHHPAQNGEEGGADIGVAVAAAVQVGKTAIPGLADPAPHRLRLGSNTSRPVTVLGMFANGLSQGNNPATTYTFMVFPQVTPNKVWEIMRIGVTAPDPFTALAGVSVLAFRSSFIPQDSNTEPATFGDLLAVLG